MPNDIASLLAGRNTAPLNPDEIRRATNVFLGFEERVNARYDATSKTVFRVSRNSSTGEVFGEVIFGPDIYPGTSVVDPNSALSLEAAAAHELTHYHRWKDKVALEDDRLKHLAEALTSLQAVSRYRSRLNDTDICGLVSDAMQRIRLHVEQSSPPIPAAQPLL